MKKILVVRSYGYLFEPLLEYLTTGANPAVDVLRTAGPHQAVPELEAIENVYTLEKARFDPDSIRPELQEKLLENTYDAVYIIYPNFEATGFRNIERLVEPIDAEKIYGITNRSVAPRTVPEEWTATENWVRFELTPEELFYRKLKASGVPLLSSVVALIIAVTGGVFLFFRWLCRRKN